MMTGGEAEFSVVIPVRNGEEYIAHAIESVLGQTYQRFSILVLENWSQDRTVEIVRSFEDPRIAIFPAVSPLDIEDNWARILDMDLLEYVTMMGYDDAFHPEFLEEIVSLIRDQPDASLYQAHFSYVDPDGGLLRHCLPNPYRESADSFLQSIVGRTREYCGTGYVMRSADYKLTGGIPPFPSLLYADAVAWYNLAKLSYKVCSPRYLVACKVHEENVHHKSDVYKHYEAGKRFLAFLLETDYFKERGPAAAVEFVQGHYTRVIHRTLLALMGTPGNRAVGEYRAVKKQVMAQAASEGAFEIVLDAKARLYELLASLPLPFFRRILWRLLTGMSRFRIRDRRKEPPTWPRSVPEEGA